MSKSRLDDRVMREAGFSGLEAARAAIMAGLVYVNGQKLDKPGSLIGDSAQIEVRRSAGRYVGRGGLKLEKAIKTFHLDLNGKVVLDAGSSTGGFTDCALQHGAVIVYAVDVSYGQLAWRLRQDPRVKVLERTNIRYLKPENLEQTPDFAVIDLSFISLTKVLPNIFVLLQGQGEGVALIKPQFEALKEQVEAKGVVRDPEVHRKVLQQIAAYINHLNGQVKGLDFSPITGPAGNIEYLMHFSVKAGPGAGTAGFDYHALVEKARVQLIIKNAEFIIET